MKVEVIGTGSMYTKYHGACALINEEILIDVPNGTVKQLLRTGHSLEKIKTIIITHKHGDHTADIPFLFKYLQVQNKTRNPLTIIGPKGIQKKIVSLFKAFNFENKKQIKDLVDVQYIEITNIQQTLKQQNNQIEAIMVSHGEEQPCYGYVINKKLGYTGDTTLCTGVEKIWQLSQIIIGDSNSNKAVSTHIHIEQIRQLLEKQTNKTFVATHMGDATREALLKEKIPNVIIPEDGYMFEI